MTIAEELKEMIMNNHPITIREVGISIGSCWLFFFFLCFGYETCDKVCVQVVKFQAKMAVTEELVNKFENNAKASQQVT